eukprot:351604-Prymnesium_polylepis.1
MRKWGPPQGSCTGSPPTGRRSPVTCGHETTMKLVIVILHRDETVQIHGQKRRGAYLRPAKGAQRLGR